jgi:hypothetical protein
VAVLRNCRRGRHDRYRYDHDSLLRTIKGGLALAPLGDRRRHRRNRVIRSVSPSSPPAPALDEVRSWAALAVTLVQLPAGASVIPPALAAPLRPIRA